MQYASNYFLVGRTRIYKDQPTNEDPVVKSCENSPTIMWKKACQVIACVIEGNICEKISDTNMMKNYIFVRLDGCKSWPSGKN